MDEITWRETDREEAIRLYSAGAPMSYSYNGDYIRASCRPSEYWNSDFPCFRVDANFGKAAEDGNKIIRYDWRNNRFNPASDDMHFPSEEAAKEHMSSCLLHEDDGVVEDDEYIIYKITYEPVKRLRVKINTTLEEIQ